MEKITLYRYTSADGGVSVSTVKPDTESTELTRLVADEGCALTNGETTTPCTDTDNPDIWTEIPDPGDLTETEQKAQAYDIITGEAV